MHHKKIHQNKKGEIEWKKTKERYAYRRNEINFYKGIKEINEGRYSVKTKLDDK